MALSKEKRIIIFIVIDIIFFLVEIFFGYYTHSLALVADAFHMLNDVISLCVGLWAVRVATQRKKSPEYTYGWARAELLGGFVNGIFLIALCLTIFLDSIQRFFEPQLVKKPKVVFGVGTLGLVFNILGLFVFGHGHDHGHGDEHDDGEHDHEHGHEHVDELDAAEHGHSSSIAGPQTITSPSKNAAKITWDNNVESRTSAESHHRNSASSRSISHQRRASKSNDKVPYPGSIRDDIISLAKGTAGPGRYDQETDSEGVASEDNEDPSEESPLLANGKPKPRPNSRKSSRHQKHDENGVNIDHRGHIHEQQKGSAKKGGHSHDDMNIRGIFLHVLGDALGNAGVMATALIIWLTDWPFRVYCDPIISLVITLIILKSAIPLCLDTARPLLQAVPGHINIEDIKKDILSLSPYILDIHHVHVWALTPTKLVATLDIKLDMNFEGRNAQKYMHLAMEIQNCLAAYGIHNSTIQPEFCANPELERANGSRVHQSDSSASTAQTALHAGEYGTVSQKDGSGDVSELAEPVCLLDRGKQCCSSPACAEGAANKKAKDDHGHSHH